VPGRRGIFRTDRGMGLAPSLVQKPGALKALACREDGVFLWGSSGNSGREHSYDLRRQGGQGFTHVAPSSGTEEGIPGPFLATMETPPTTSPPRQTMFERSSGPRVRERTQVKEPFVSKARHIHRFHRPHEEHRAKKEAARDRVIFLSIMAAVVAVGVVVAVALFLMHRQTPE
jgi:hypothetical protein